MQQQLIWARVVVAGRKKEIVVVDGRGDLDDMDNQQRGDVTLDSNSSPAAARHMDPAAVNCVLMCLSTGISF